MGCAGPVRRTGTHTPAGHDRAHDRDTRRTTGTHTPAHDRDTHTRRRRFGRAQDRDTHTRRARPGTQDRDTHTRGRTTGRAQDRDTHARPGHTHPRTTGTHTPGTTPAIRAWHVDGRGMDTHDLDTQGARDRDTRASPTTCTMARRGRLARFRYGRPRGSPLRVVSFATAVTLRSTNPCNPDPSRPPGAPRPSAWGRARTRCRVRSSAGSPRPRG